MAVPESVATSLSGYAIEHLGSAGMALLCRFAMRKKTVAKGRRSGVRDSFQAELIRATQRGGITLVLGAGLSMPRGIPDWNTLARVIWRDVFPKRPSPWARQRESSPKELPQFLPITFELAYQKLGASGFLDVLKRHLYSEATFPFTDSNFGRSN